MRELLGEASEPPPPQSTVKSMEAMESMEGMEGLSAEVRFAMQQSPGPFVNLCNLMDPGLNRG